MAAEIVAVSTGAAATVAIAVVFGAPYVAKT